MMRLGKDEIMFMNALSKISGVNARDCLIGEKMISFVVKEADMGNAIGKKGEKVQRLKKILNRNIELVPYTTDPARFVSQSFDGISFGAIELQNNDEKKILSVKMDSENKRKLLQNLGKMKRVKELAKRNYGIGDIWIK